jgi:hypothetical protein
MKTTTTQRLIAKIVRDLRRRQTFDSYADLTRALRLELHRLGIRYRQSELDDAIGMVESNLRLVGTRPVRNQPVYHLVVTPPTSRQDAAAICGELLARWRQERARV